MLEKDRTFGLNYSNTCLDAVVESALEDDEDIEDAFLEDMEATGEDTEIDVNGEIKDSAIMELLDSIPGSTDVDDDYDAEQEEDDDEDDIFGL